MAFNTNELDKILAAVKENRRKLDGCAGPHDFQPVEDTILPSGHRLSSCHRYCCTKCQGEVDSIARHWYLRGFEHGRQQGRS